MSATVRRTIVCDAGPLIALAKIEQLSLLSALFETVNVPSVVLSETSDNVSQPGASAILSFVKSHATVFDTLTDSFATRLASEVDRGETQAIVVARQLGCLALIDDRIARSVATRLNVHVIGTLGVLLRAKRSGLVPAIRPHLEAMVKAQYRISPALIQEALRLASEESS